MQLAILASTSASLAGTRSRREKVQLLSDCLRRMTSVERYTGVSYLTGMLPQGKIGLGYATLRATVVEPATAATLSVADADAAFQRMSEQIGSGSTAIRKQLLAGLLQRATSAEQAFLRQLILGELRQGALEGVMVDAIAHATGQPVDAVRKAVMVSGDPADVAAAALQEGRAGLARFSLQLFRPLKPMLAQPAQAAGDALARIGRAALEYKLDGARVQIHKLDEEVQVFTRHLNEVTGSAPELVDALQALPVKRLILDGEAVALDAKGRPLPFQVTMQRFGRRRNVAQVRERVPLSAFYFDCLHLDGTDLIDQPATVRSRALAESVPARLRVPRRVTAREEEAEAFLRQALAAGHEGIMAKSLEASYRAGSRGSDWFKIKPAHTLDLVVLAAEWGSGRRRGKLSNLHLGARDPGSNTFVMLGKTFKGLTDATLEWQTQALLALEIGREGHTVHVRPELVVEVAFNELQRSSQYPAGMALRFARVKRYRPDKSAKEADTIATVDAIYKARMQGPAS